MDRVNGFRRCTITVVLVAINIGYLIFMYATGSVQNSQLAVEYGALYGPAVIEGHQYYRLVTAMFMHFGVGHLFGNMILLYALGRIIEEELGKIKYVAVYLLSGIVGNIVSVIYYMSRSVNAVSAGASGAVFGLVGVILWLIIVNHGQYKGINIFRILLMIAFALYSGWTGSGINNAAHVAGLVTGFVLGAAFIGKGCRSENDRFYC